MSESRKPIPPWQVRLEGADADLKDLASCLTEGKIRVVPNDGAYFLESLFLDEIRDPAVVPGKARELLHLVSSVARVRRSMAKPIGFSAFRWKDSTGTWRQKISTSVSITVYSNITRLTTPGAFERCLKLAMNDDWVRMTLDDLLGNWDFPRLRRIGETILLDLGSGNVRKGVDQVVKRGWASRTDCDHFWQAVNYGDMKFPGAHSRLRRQPGNNPQNVIKAGEFLSDLVEKWLESKM